MIAAIIVAGLVISIATVANVVNTRQNNEAFYDLSEETGFEAKRVLDHGVFNAFDSQEFDETLGSLLVEYADYIAHDQVIFIYGDANQLFGQVFEDRDQGSVGINTGTIPATVVIQYTTGREADVGVDYGDDGKIDKVFVSIGEEVYNFDLREGENFFFLIIKDEEGERFVASG